MIELKDTEISDLEELFQFQTDEEANFLAAFTAKNPSDKEAYLEKFTKILADREIVNKTVFFNGKIAGSVAKRISVILNAVFAVRRIQSDVCHAVAAPDVIQNREVLQIVRSDVGVVRIVRRDAVVGKINSQLAV